MASPPLGGRRANRRIRVPQEVLKRLQDAEMRRSKSDKLIANYEQ